MAKKEWKMVFHLSLGIFSLFATTGFVLILFGVNLGIIFSLDCIITITTIFSLLHIDKIIDVVKKKEEV